MAKFCANCGSELQDNQDVCLKCGVNVKKETPRFNNIIQKRDIAMTVILSIITCGIYGWVWLVMITNDNNTLNNDVNETSGGLALIYTIITCGIYGIYWCYKMGKKLYEAGKKYNKEIADNSVLYIILAILGLQIVNFCLIQNDLNKFAQ